MGTAKKKTSDEFREGILGSFGQLQNELYSVNETLGDSGPTLHKANEESVYDMPIVKEGKPLRVSHIPFDWVEESPYQPRTAHSSALSEQSLIELAQEIYKNGIKQPPRVRIIGPQKVQLIGGARRYKASLIAREWALSKEGKYGRLEKLPVVIYEMDDMAAASEALTDNEYRVDQSDFERARGCKALHQDFGFKVEAIGELLSWDRKKVYAHLKFWDLPKEVISLLEKSKDILSYSYADKAVSWLSSNKDNKESAEKALFSAIDKLSKDQIKQSNLIQEASKLLDEFLQESENTKEQVTRLFNASSVPRLKTIRKKLNSGKEFIISQIGDKTNKISLEANFPLKKEERDHLVELLSKSIEELNIE